MFFEWHFLLWLSSTLKFFFRSDLFYHTMRKKRHSFENYFFKKFSKTAVATFCATCTVTGYLFNFLIFAFLYLGKYFTKCTYNTIQQKIIKLEQRLCWFLRPETALTCFSKWDLVNYLPPPSYCNGGGGGGGWGSIVNKIQKYKIRMCLTVQFFLYKGRG